MIQRRISLSPEPAPPVNSGEPLKTMASRPPPSSGALQLADHVLEEQERAVVDARQAGPEATAEAELVVLVLDLPLDLLPLDAERRIGEEVVVAAPLKASSLKLLPRRMFDAFWPLSIMSRAADGVGLGVQLLAVALEPRARVQLAEVLRGDREHPAGAAGRVEHRPHDARRPQRLVVLDEEEVDHEADDLARREVLAGGLVRQLGEPADQLLVQVAHLDVADGVGVEVDLGDLRQDEVQELRAVEPADLGVEVELLDDVAGLGVERRDPGAEVAGDLRRVGEDLLRGSAGEVL